MWAAGLTFLPLLAVAQGAAPEAVADLPKSVGQYWDLGITAVTPVLVTLVWKCVPKLPKWVLPAITPLIGLGLGLAVNWLAAANLGWVDMAKAGALAVFIREIVNQAVTKRMAAPDTVPAPN